MTKIEMVNKIGESVALPKSDIEKILDQFVKATQDTLKAGDKVSLTGLGSFIPKDRKARTARNPKTGAAVNVPNLSLAPGPVSEGLGACRSSSACSTRGSISRRSRNASWEAR